MRRASMTGWMVLAAVAGSAAPAETFHSQDGVWFEGTIRMVASGAAVCNVLEGRYREPVYERLKANHGQPLDLWRVDIAVRNESGRWIDSLRAESWVRSEYPPCTDWTGLQAPPDPSIRVEWGDSLQLQQMPYGMSPGQEERSAVYLLAFHQHRPRFGEWDVRYDFAKEAGTDTGLGVGGAPFVVETVPGDAKVELLSTREPYRPRMQLATGPYHVEISAPGYETRRMWVEHAGASPHRIELEHMQRAIAEPPRAEVSPEGWEQRSRPDGKPICAGQPRGTACWMELRNWPGCFVWNAGLVPGVTATWSGECSADLAGGRGTLTWTWGSNEGEETGLLRAGQRTGAWVLRNPDGTVSEGSYEDGRRSGAWVIRYADGWVDNGSYEDGKRSGQWVSRIPDGTVYEGSYVDGNRNGQWVRRRADGSTETETWVDGVEQ